MGYFRKRQPRSSAKWNHSARHLLIRPALQSHIPGVPRCALPLLPPLQPPELTCLMFRVPSPIQQGASRLEAHAAVFRGETPKPAEARKTKATQRVRQAAENTFSSPFSFGFLFFFFPCFLFVLHDFFFFWYISNSQDLKRQQVGPFSFPRKP